eukprot:s293_g1.t3
MATGEDALDLGEHHIRRKMVAVKNRQKDGSMRLDETIRSSRDLFLAGTAATTGMTPTATGTGFFKKKHHGEGAFVGQHANESQDQTLSRPYGPTRTTYLHRTPLPLGIDRTGAGFNAMEPPVDLEVPAEGAFQLPTSRGLPAEDSGLRFRESVNVNLVSITPKHARQVSVMSTTEAQYMERINSDELAREAKRLQKEVKEKSVKKGVSDSNISGKSKKSLLVESVLGAGDGSKHHGHSHKKGAFAGVFVPTCENMWGVLIFLRFYFVVGQAGILHALLCVLISFTAAFCTTSSMSAIVSSGGMVSKGGPYYMISRALGPAVGASVGIMYWLAITLLAVLETLGAVEALLMAAPSLDFPGCKQAFGSGFMIALVLCVWGGSTFVTKLGIFFVLIVFYTMASYYAGLIMAPFTEAALANPWVTGLSLETFNKNWLPHYDSETNFGVVLSVFFPCFTGILSGANRADILRDGRDGTFGAIIFSFFMYSSFFILWGCVADYRYLQGKDSWCSFLPFDRLFSEGFCEIVWNPFPHSAQIGIIISSLSQALQCLIVAPRLLQNIAREEVSYLACASYSKNGAGNVTDYASCAAACDKGEGLQETYGTHDWKGSSGSGKCDCKVSDSEHRTACQDTGYSS